MFPVYLFTLAHTNAPRTKTWSEMVCFNTWNSQVLSSFTRLIILYAQQWQMKLNCWKVRLFTLWNHESFFLKLVNISPYWKLTLSLSRECVIGTYVHSKHAPSEKLVALQNNFVQKSAELNYGGEGTLWPIQGSYAIKLPWPRTRSVVNTILYSIIVGSIVFEKRDKVKRPF